MPACPYRIRRPRSSSATGLPRHRLQPRRSTPRPVHTSVAVVNECGFGSVVTTLSPVVTSSMFFFSPSARATSVPGRKLWHGEAMSPRLPPPARIPSPSRLPRRTWRRWPRRRAGAGRNSPGSVLPSQRTPYLRIASVSGVCFLPSGRSRTCPGSTADGWWPRRRWRW